jgi:hypothetical protein
MAPKTVCDAHGILVDVLDGLKKGQIQLYDLDREKAREMSEIRESVARLETSTSAGFTAIETWQKAFEKKQSDRDAKIIESLSRAPRAKWTPKTIIGLVGAIVGPSGIAALILLFR